jgi:hypothetical protein
MSKGERMKSLRYLSVLLLFMATASSAVAFQTKTVTVTNNTSYTMGEFYASPSADSGWDTNNNLLAGQTLGPGQSTTITIADDEPHCHYDLMAILYGSAEYAYQYEVNTCSGGIWNVSR